MYRVFIRRSVTICGAIIAPRIDDYTTTDADHLRKGGWDKVVNIFQMNEYYELSPPTINIIHCTMYTSLFGIFYGGYVESREAYLRFIEGNLATKFPNHFEAKKQLQNSVTLSFLRGAFRWGVRLAFFSCSFMTVVTCLSAYRGDSSVMDFVAAGLFSGAIYRLHMGVRALIVSSTLGAMMGLFAGTMTTFLFKLTGKNLQNLEEWNTSIVEIRRRHMRESMKKALQPKGEATELAKEHDVKLANDEPQ